MRGESELARIGAEAMTLVDALRATYGDDVEIGTVAIIVDVVAQDEDDEPINPIVYSCSDLEEALDRAQVRERGARNPRAR